MILGKKKSNIYLCLLIDMLPFTFFSINCTNSLQFWVIIRLKEAKKTLSNRQTVDIANLALVVYIFKKRKKKPFTPYINFCFGQHGCSGWLSITSAVT